MFYSRCLLSQKARLGAIRVAAYCIKRLKKLQVNETDIRFSVDKILQDEINDQTYRVLAALLLGLVRIYSKKVEYLVHECNEVLLKIKKFMINTNGKGPVETLCATITRPESFELDAFDLEVSEDVSGGNIAPLEEITLKDVWEKEQIGQFSLDKFQFEKFSCSLNLISADNQMVEEDFHQSHQMDISFEVAGPSSPTNLLAGQDTSPPQKQANLATDLAPELLEEQVNLLSRDKQEDFTVSFHGEVGPAVPFKTSDESYHQVVAEEQIEARGNQMHEEAEEVHEARNSEASLEWIRDDQSYQEENTLLNNKSSVSKETLEEHIGESNGDINTEQNLGLTEYVSMDGATEPKDMHIPTPAAREGARFKRKRKTIIDGVIMLSNEKLNELKSDKVASPNTPPLLSTIQSVEGRNDVTPLSPHEGLRREQPQRNDEQLNMMNVENNHSHCNVETLSLYESLEADQSFGKDEEHSLMNEDSYSYETENSQSCGWTGKTREVAMDLQRSFLSLRDQKEGDVVNFSQVFGSKTRKESARLFYEILVLKITDFVDAKQEEAYGDISIRKLPKWDETFGVDGF
ncbi:hypothetical protein K1719_001731 [Acacia pycnantha]|nr:hypothetical protein K1719_001731 [Acacia pycnantha]